MKRILSLVILVLVMYSCKNGTTGSPKNAVADFIEASKEGDLTEVKKHITRSDKNLLEMGESFLARFDSNSANEMKNKMSKEFKEKTRDFKIDIKDEKIDGDNATVNVEFELNGKKETRPFSLVKEDGQWKISLLSTGMKNSGAKQEDMDEAMKSMNMDSMQNSINEGMKEFNKMDKDSLKKVIEEAMKGLKKPE